MYIQCSMIRFVIKQIFGLLSGWYNLIFQGLVHRPSCTQWWHQTLPFLNQIVLLKLIQLTLNLAFEDEVNRWKLLVDEWQEAAVCTFLFFGVFFNPRFYNMIWFFCQTPCRLDSMCIDTVIRPEGVWKMFL